MRAARSTSVARHDERKGMRKELARVVNAPNAMTRDGDAGLPFHRAPTMTRLDVAARDDREE
jgi:hypothetical protein